MYVENKERALLKDILHSSWDYTRWNILKDRIEMLLRMPESEPSVKIPESEDEAAMMALLGFAWLRDHAPHRLVQHTALDSDWKDFLIDELQSQFDTENIQTSEGESLITLEGAICAIQELTPPKRVPISEEKIANGFKKLSTGGIMWFRKSYKCYLEGVRFAELEHNIRKIDE